MPSKKRRNNGIYYWPKPIKCPICKKYFYPAPLHAYKIGYSDRPELVCTYHCMRAWEKDRSIYKPVYRGKKKEVEEDDYFD